MISPKSLVLISRLPFLRRRRRLQLTTLGDLSKWATAHLRCIADVLKFARNTNRLEQFSTILPSLNMDQIDLLENVAAADDAHIKYFHRQQPPACLRS